jgi:hypothetical protein
VSDRRFYAWVALGLALGPLAGCARLVVLDPDVVASQNSPDWAIRRQPGGPVAPPVAPSASAASAAAPPRVEAPPPATASESSADEDD